MRTILAGCVIAATLLVAEAASAGCWATVGLAPPQGTSAGEVWVAKLTVLQHGRNPLPDAAAARPTVTIENGETGQSRTFAATATDPSKGVYEARVVFPSAGTWRYEVFDGFTSWGGEEAPCAQTHTFAAVSIGAAPVGGPPPGGERFPVWAVVVGGVLGASALAATAIGSRRLRVARQSQL